jgi:macrolide transport system ATP-binding/permease protein
MAVLFELKDVRLSYQMSGATEDVLRGIDLAIHDKDFLALKGPSGSGKSTLLYILGLLLKPTSGKVYFKGKDTSKLDDKSLAIIRNRRIGFVFQQFHLIPKATVLDNILLPTYYPSEYARRTPELIDKAKKLAERLGLSHVLDHTPSQLSGGQQQRVAIARSLINDPDIILADEPTGNLDSKNTTEILRVFRELHDEGRTIIVITHEEEVAGYCDQTIDIRDGLIVSNNRNSIKEPDQSSPPNESTSSKLVARTPLSHSLSLMPAVLSNLKRNKARSFLTMLGIIIGIASVLSMTTLGEYTKKRIVEGYETLGVNRLGLWGYRNWRQRAIDQVTLPFQGFDPTRELPLLMEIFDGIQMISPVMSIRNKSATFAGRQMDNVNVIGISPEYFMIADWPLLIGDMMTHIHVDNQSPVCIVGKEVGKQLFNQVTPIGQVIQLGDDDSNFGCRVLGVLESKTLNATSGTKTDEQIFLPYSYLRVVTSAWWERDIQQIVMKIKTGYDIEKTANQIKGFFQNKYGKAAIFNVNKEDVILYQVKRMLNIFSVLLASIAGISLLVGGIGITNMMMVALAERYREIGLRKALGATHKSIKLQFLFESVALCSLAGVIGLVLGFAAYEGIIYFASKFFDNLQFTWMWNPMAVGISIVCTVAVGIISGLIPAIKAEKLQVIEALRSE